jgi:acetolactate decarboxylase
MHRTGLKPQTEQFDKLAAPNKNGKMKIVVRVLFPALVMMLGCGREPVVEVTRIGELEELIKKGDMKTHTHLRDYVSTPHLYAIGSVTDLKGFIQVIDGRVYTGSVKEGGVNVDSSGDVDATLLLFAHVNEWKEFDIPDEVKTWKQLEQFIGDQAVKFGIPKNRVSPFQLKGPFAKASWRVVDWDPADKEVTYKKTVQSGLHGDLINEDISAVGFYSRQSYEVLAHKETNMHVHFVNHDHSIAGHLDDLELDGRVKLYLPKPDPAKQ